MDKKAYIIPAVEDMNIETVEMIAASGDGMVNIYNETTEDDAYMGRGRRGSWGNLWEKGE